MQRGVLGPIVVLLVAVGLAPGGPPSTPEPIVALPTCGHSPCPVHVVPFGLPLDPCDDGCPPRLWLGAEYLLWWVRSGPMPTPLVTTGNPAAGALAGAIGHPDTRVLFGGEDLDYGTFSGIRFTLGCWLDEDGLMGVEARGFLLEHRAVTFAANADAAGEPPIYLPAFNDETRTEGRVIVADLEQGFAGNVAVSTVTRLWGAEANGLMNVLRDERIALDVLAGFRYLHLDESLRLTNTTTDLPSRTVTILSDLFDTRNQFYGGQVGARGLLMHGPWLFGVTGKVAVGSSRQVVNINGSIAQRGPVAPAPGPFAGGFYTQPSNIGRRITSQFDIVPEFEGKVCYEFRCGVQLFAGYNFLYWNQVVRPGEQIDRILNLSQSPVFGRGALVGAAHPKLLFDRSDFWAHGLEVGVQVSY